MKMRFAMIVLLLHGCNMAGEQQSPTTMDCTASCEECKSVDLSCTGHDATENSESLDISK